VVSNTRQISGLSWGIFHSKNNGALWAEIDSEIHTNRYTAGGYINVECLAANDTNLFAIIQSQSIKPNIIYDLFQYSANGWKHEFSPDFYNYYFYPSLAVNKNKTFIGIKYFRHPLLYLSFQGDTSWTITDTTLDIKSLTVTENNLWAGTNGNGVYLSTDNGHNWITVGNRLSKDTITSLVVYGTTLVAGTSHGVFILKNNDLNWIPYNDGLTDTNTVALAANNSYLFSAGKNGGLWRRPIADVSARMQFQNATNKYSFNIISRNRLNPNATVNFSLPSLQQVNVSVYNLSGHKIATIVNNRLNAGSHTLQWNTINLASGCYTMRIQTESGTVVKSIPVVR
jgi:hypothetical protein